MTQQRVMKAQPVAVLNERKVFEPVTREVVRIIEGQDGKYGEVQFQGRYRRVKYVPDARSWIEVKA